MVLLCKEYRGNIALKNEAGFMPAPVTKKPDRAKVRLSKSFFLGFGLEPNFLKMNEW
jgi:hypothetical protein